MLFFGTFSSRTSEGRRYHIRCYAALFLVVVLLIVAFLVRQYVPRLSAAAVAAVPGAGFAYIGWEFRRYLMALDELARRIQLEAVACTYLTGLAGAAMAGGLLWAYGGDVQAGWLNPFPLFLLLEPVRGIWLYVVSRRYE